MTDFVITIKTGTSEEEISRGEYVARILRTFADRIEDWEDDEYIKYNGKLLSINKDGNIRDKYDNIVGTFEVQNDEWLERKRKENKKKLIWVLIAGAFVLFIFGFII
jgi:hypothetical protein